MSDEGNSIVTAFNDAPSWAVALGTLGATGAGYALVQLWRNREALKVRLINAAQHMPGVGAAISSELAKELKAMEDEIYEKLGDCESVLELPASGWSADDIESFMQALKEREEGNWRSGKVSGVVYHGGDDHIEIQTKALRMFALSNPLHPDVFPSIKKFEGEIIAMTVRMLGGRPARDGAAAEGGSSSSPDVSDVCGAVTSGGTESILMAVKAHREFYAKGKPNIVIPISAHAAFNKAGQYFGVEVRSIPVDPKTFRADVPAMEAAIDSNTIMLVGSAPSYAHGMMDDIVALGKVAKKHGVGLHVDGCLGGFLMPWLERVEGFGEGIAPFDFRVDGVTSMSADTHKYGYAVKGTSVVLFRNQELRRNMYFMYTSWTGGIYASPTIAGSRPGALVAACWASLVKMGVDGFMECATKIAETQKIIKAGIREEIPELELVGDSHSMVVAFRSAPAVAKTLNIFGVMQGMKDLGWNLNPLQKPNSVHVCVTYRMADAGADFIADLKTAVAKVLADREHYESHGAAPLYGMAHSLSGTDVGARSVAGFLDILLNAR